MKIKYMLIILIYGLLGYCTTDGNTQEKKKTSLLLVDSYDSTGLKLRTLPLKKHSDFKNDTKDVTNKYEEKFWRHPKINQERLACVSIALVSLNYAAYQPFKDAWWKEERMHFHFYQGWRRNKGYLDFGWYDTLYGHIDKLGHYFSARLLSEQIHDISRWIGFDERSSKLIGPALSSLLMLEIEIYDGFFKDWGFSLADFTANELGAFSPLIKEKIPFLNNFQFKFSYHSSNFPKQASTFIKDYPGMTFWLCFNTVAALPGKTKNCVPSWLNLALGYSVSKPARGDVEIFLAPDINWMKVPLGHSQTMYFIQKTLNYFHFPCFALKLTSNKKFYPIYF